MSETKITHAVTVRAVLELNEAELGALDALVGYGTDPFLKCFYQHMGRAYLEPHEAGLRSLFANISTVAPKALHDAKTMRDIMRQNPKALLDVPAEAPKPEPKWFLAGLLGMLVAMVFFGFWTLMSGSNRTPIEIIVYGVLSLLVAQFATGFIAEWSKTWKGR